MSNPLVFCFIESQRPYSFELMLLVTSTIQFDFIHMFKYVQMATLKLFRWTVDLKENDIRAQLYNLTDE